MSDFSVSTVDIDILDFTSSRSQSPTSMALRSPLGPPSSVSEPGEKETMSSAIPTSHKNNVEDEHPIIDPGVAIDSFLPLLEALESPGLQLVDGKYYHLRGLISKDSFKKLSDYARSITKFTLNDAHPLVDAGILLRLVQLDARYNKSDTLFPSLKSLHIDVNNLDTSLSLLPLFLVPTLEVLAVEHVPESQLDTFLTFLDTLAYEAPRLSSIALGTSLPYHTFHSTCMRFVNLRELSLRNTGPILNWTTLQALGQLPELETLVLDAEAASYRSHLQADVSDILELPGSASPGAPEAVSSETRFGGQVWGSLGPAEFVPPLSSNGYNMFGNPIQTEPNILVPLPERVPSPSPSIPSIDEPDNFEIPAKPIEPEEYSVLSPKVGFHKLRTLHVVANVDLMNELINLITSVKMVDISLTLTPSVLPPKPKRPQKGKKVKSSAITTTQALDSNSELGAKHFQNTLQKVLASWAHSLTTISIYCKRVSSDDPQPELELLTFRSLLSHSRLRHLTISGWTMSSDFGDALHHLSTLAQSSNLETLHLPIDLGAKGISLNRLRGILESCPSLTSFQCGFKHISNVPPIPKDGMMFGVKTLAVGNPVAHDDRRRLMAIAQYLDALFPKLECIKTQEGCNAQQWQEIHELVQMCQLSRSHHRLYIERI